MTEVERYLRPKDVCFMHGMSIRTFWRKVKTEEGFPKPIKDGNRSLIASSDVSAYQERKYKKNSFISENGES